MPRVPKNCTSQFTEICGFFQQFHKALKFKPPLFKQLEKWLCDRGQVSKGLVELHVDILCERFERLEKGSFDWKTKLVTALNTETSVEEVSLLSTNGYAFVSTTTRFKILLHLLRSLLDARKFLHKCEKLNLFNHIQFAGTDRYGNTLFIKLEEAAPNALYIQKFDKNFRVAESRTELLKFIHNLSIRTSYSKEEQQMLYFLRLITQGSNKMFLL